MYTGKTLFSQLMDFVPWTHLREDRGALWRRPPGADAVLRRAVPSNGVRAADLAGEPARHRDLSVGSRRRSSTTWASANPCGARRWPMPTKERDWLTYAQLAQRLIVQARKLYAGEDLGLDLDQHRLCARLDDHRPLSGGVPVGAFPHHQGGGEDAHAARSARQYPELHPRLGRQAPRRSRPRPAAPRRRVLSTSWIAAMSTSPGCTRSIWPARSS